MLWYILLPMIIQALATIVDEGYFHYQRGLPRWERIGHPLDTLTVMACFLFTQLMSPSPANLKLYLGLVVVSCLFVTKDEVVHTELCSVGEQWLHSLMLLLHPIILGLVGLIWYGQNLTSLNLFTTKELGQLHQLISAQLWCISLFCLYQIVYWNLLWKPKKQ